MNSPFRAIIIDDESWIREGLTDHVDWHKLGIELVGSYEDGVEAMEVVKEQQIDIIMTDIRMPNMTGLEFIAELRRLERDNGSAHASKVVIMSGFDDFRYAQEAIRLGASDYLLKPADVEEIEEVLMNAKRDCELDRQKLSGAGHEAADIEEPSSYLIKKALRIIEEKYTEDLQLTWIADQLFVTPNYLSRLFHEETGVSFSEYLSKKRIQKACELLKDGTLKVYQVGEAIGYENPRYFSEWFRKQTGLTPGEYRHNNS